MRVYYDYQICIGQAYGGISRYYYELIHHMKKLNIAEPEIDCIGNVNKYFERDFGKKALQKRAGFIGLGIFFIMQGLNIWNSKKQIKKGYDIICPTYYHTYMTRCNRKNAKLVLTVYDMIHEKFADSFVKIDYTKKQKKKLILRADHIIAISESTKRDILEYYPQVPPEKISVIYIGSSFSRHKNLSINFEFPKKYILFVGRRDIYKNFARFFEAVKRILDDYRELHLLCIGGGKLTREEYKQIAGYEKQIVQIDANDLILEYAYSHAICFVFPSLYEGFGIPTLEAFTCDCPVISSNTSSMPEVGGDAVLYIDPYDCNDMEEKIRKVINDDELRKKMIQKGREQLKKFVWDDIAKQIVDCYEKVLET